MLSLHCYRGNCDLCELWPLCDCDCHPEKQLEDQLLRGELDVEQVYQRMVHRQLYRRPEVRDDRNERRNAKRRAARERAVYDAPRAPCQYPGCTNSYIVPRGAKAKRGHTHMCKRHAALVRRPKPANSVRRMK